MLVSDNEYGAPWNDQFYLVTYKENDEVQKKSLSWMDQRNMMITI